MSISHTITKTWQGQSGLPISKGVVLTASEEVNFDFQVAASTSNQPFNLAFTKVDLQSIFILSDQTVTIKTNSSSTPQDTLTITGNDPYQWDINCGIANPFAGNVTSGFTSNAGDTAANVSVRVLTTG